MPRIPTTPTFRGIAFSPSPLPPSHREQRQQGADIGLPVQVPAPVQDFLYLRSGKTRRGQRAELLLHLLVGQRVAGVAARESDLFLERPTVPGVDANEVGDAFRVFLIEFRVGLDLDLLDQCEKLFVMEVRIVEGVERDTAVREGDGHTVGQAVVSGLARGGPPLLWLAADDLDRRVEGLDGDLLDLIHAAELSPQVQSRIYSALGVV